MVKNQHTDKLNNAAKAVVEMMQLDESALFVDFAKASKLDPEIDFVGIDFNGEDFRNQDLSAYDFSGCSFENALVSGAVFNKSVNLKNAIGSPAFNTQNDVLGNVLHAIQAIESCDTLDELLASFSAFSKPLGFTYAGIGQIINPAMLDRPIADVGISDFPAEFNERWLSQGYIMHDPVLRYALSHRASFTWREAYEYATRYGRRIFDEAEEFGLLDGIVVPVIFDHSPVGLISLIHPDPKFEDAEIAHINWVCIHGYTRMLRIINAEKQDRTNALTVREIDVLHYVAAGKTNWEIGKILEISEDTIKMHKKNITRKLGAANRAHSVALAIREGQILP